jgi:hypothetical protein
MPKLAAKSIDHRYRDRSCEWRVQSDERGRFDEIVVHIGRRAKPPKRIVRGKVVPNPQADSRSGLILHAEMMSDRSCFIDVAGLCLWVHVGRKGVAEITDIEDRRGGRGLPMGLR